MACKFDNNGSQMQTDDWECYDQKTSLEYVKLLQIGGQALMRTWSASGKKNRK